MRPTRLTVTPISQLLSHSVTVKSTSTVATNVGIIPPRNSLFRRNFVASNIRRDDQSRAKGESMRKVINRPEITPLFLFTGGIIGLALFFGGRHLFKDKELRIDHAKQNRLKTQAEQLDFDSMAKVAEDPEGKLTKEAIEEDKKRSQRKEDIKQEKQEKAKNKL
ncbi:uncharacterized protein MEPE_03399 [Melanopsichium pennsylvanicum]|uniref:Uncharacterized protein n=1 Tax=Melanopsichium pennsylvanicum TaxID=63383 RepID=A0AAJ5C5F7_9BASI|nr:uncharacterized protein MEPE_03399 [Melanopsichium pennsylvanicum]